MRSEDSGDVQPADGEGLWDARDVARYFRASRSWVYHQAEAGTLPCLRIGGLLRFDPRVVRMFAAGEEPPHGMSVPHRRRDIP